MTPEILLDRLHAHGVTVVPAPGGHLRLIAERRPPAELIEAARQFKPALLRLLDRDHRADGDHGERVLPVPEAPRTAGEILFDVSKVFGPGLRVIVGGLDAPARPRPKGLTKGRSSRTAQPGGPTDGAA